MAAVRTHYETLNVSPEAEAVVIEAAYRALMKKYHPDQGSGPPPEGAPSAADINDAYAMLRDPARRSEYDKNEWIRQQNVKLASYVPPPARRTNFFAWGGWLVALVLAGMIGIIATKRDVTLSPTEAARAALMSEPDFRTQPVKPGEKLITDAEAAELRAQANAASVAIPPAPTEAETPPPAPVPPVAADAAPTAAPVAAPVARRPAPTRWRKAPPPRRPRYRASAREKDFLERQGYIY